MEIKRAVFGQEISIKLTDAEIMEAYREAKKELAYNEVKETLMEWDLGEVLKNCKFPYPGHAYLLDTKIEEAENKIMENKELLVSIHECFEEEQEITRKNYAENMNYAITVMLAKFGEENPDFLKQFEDIKVVAYEKYKEAWVTERNYSEEFLAGIKREFEEEVLESGGYSCFEEYIDEHGYHGELYVCFEEFLGAEYQDLDYMKELLNEAEFAEYLNDLGLGIKVLEFGKLYEEEKLTYLTNALGEFSDDNNPPPEAAYEWYEELGIGTSSLLYLVDLEDTIGVLALNEYDQCTCDDYFHGNRQLMSEFVHEKADLISKHEGLSGYQVIKGIETGFDECDEIGLFIPYPMDKEIVKKLLSTLDEMVYEGSKEFVESLENQEFHKEYSDYSNLRETLQHGIYDLMQDSLGQWNKGGFSTDITVRDYDGKLCIDYDVYQEVGEDFKYLDGGKVCDVKDMPEKEKDFASLIDKAVQKHLDAVLINGTEKKESLDGKTMDICKLCELYNMSDLDALHYAKKFCSGDNIRFVDDLINANLNYIEGESVETTIKNEDLYHQEKKRFFQSFGVDFDNSGEMIPVITNKLDTKIMDANKRIGDKSIKDVKEKESVR